MGIFDFGQVMFQLVAVDNDGEYTDRAVCLCVPICVVRHNVLFYS